MRFSFLATAAGLSTIVSARNPLDTEDQVRLDALAVEINRDNSFKALRWTARNTIVGTLKLRGKSIDESVSKDIDVAVDELVFSAIQKAVNNDPAYPKVYSANQPPRVIRSLGLSVPGGRYSYDNPDCVYRTIPISARYEYLVHGRRAAPGPSDVTFSLISNPNSQGTVASLLGEDLVVRDDGTYTIRIKSAKSSEKNYIQSDGSAVQLFVRNNIGDWAVETPDDLTVEVVGDHDAAPVTKDDIVRKARANLAESIFFYDVGALGFKTLLHPVNKIEDPSQSQTLGTLTTQASSFAHFNLKDDQALVISFDKGLSTYWVLPIYSLGMVTHSPWNSIVSFNNKQAAANNDGTYTFVISAKDPGTYNWLNITSHPQGLIMGRWQGLPRNGTEHGIKVQSSVVPIAGIRDVLPPETRFVTASEREEQIRLRVEGYDRIRGD